jgi:hypothetical protein
MGEAAKSARTQGRDPGRILACSLLLATIAASIGAGPAGAAEATATFGKTSVGGSSDVFASNRKRVNQYSLPVAGAVSKLSVYLAPSGTSGQQLLEGVLYADSAGKPAGLLGTTAQVAFSSANAAGWYDLAFAAPINLAAGSYWIGVITGEAGKVAGFRYDSVASSRDYNANTYTSGPSNPFGAATVDSEQMSLFATYTTSSSQKAPANTEAPKITGSAEVGQTLSTSNGSWTESPTSFTYEWQRCNSSGSGCVEIPGATGSTYKVASGDVGSTLRAAVTAHNSAGPSAPADSNLTAVVTEPARLMPPSNTEAPKITGSAEVGQTLSTSNGSWTESPTSFTYEWQRCNSSGSGCVEIPGATGSAYKVASGDVGTTLRAAVTAHNSAGPSTPADSNLTAVVPAAPSTCGKTTVGGSSDYFGLERKRVNRCTLPEAAAISKLSVYLAPTGTAGEQVLEGIVYADNAGSPQALLGVTEQLTFKSTAAAGWYQLPFATALKLAAGNYWIGVITGATAKVAGFRFDSVSGARDYNANSYSSGPSNPFGAATIDSEQMSLFATFTPAEGSKDTTPPSVPEGLKASATGSTQISLSWNASSDDVGVAGYTIRREGTVIATVSATTTSYTDSALSPSTTYSYTVDAFDAAGNHSAQSAPASATTFASSGTQHYEYVFPSNAIDVYDLDNGFKLLKTIPLPAAATDIRGAAACPSTHVLYVSYGHDSSASGGGVMLAYDLVAEKTLWTRSYSEGIDSMAITPDCKTIYMPVGEASSAANWNVLEAATGNITGSIEGGSGPHNTIVSLNGQHVYMGPRNAGFLTVAETGTGKVIRSIGPLLHGGVRPFTVNGKETLAFTTATGFLGFQVSSIATGQVLYTVPVSPSSEFPYTEGQPGPSSPSHGISLSPDEKELWVMDQPNSYVHVFDITGLPSSAPVQVANIKLTRAMTGSQVGCTYDCLREGWLQHTLDGRFVIVGDSGDVIDTKTRQSVANAEPLYNSRVFLEIDWSGGVPVATSTRSGLGYVTH